MSNLPPVVAATRAYLRRFTERSPQHCLGPFPVPAKIFADEAGYRLAAAPQCVICASWHAKYIARQLHGAKFKLAVDWPSLGILLALMHTVSWPMRSHLQWKVCQPLDNLSSGMGHQAALVAKHIQLPCLVLPEGGSNCLVGCNLNDLVITGIAPA